MMLLFPAFKDIETAVVDPEYIEYPFVAGLVECKIKLIPSEISRTVCLNIFVIIPNEESGFACWLYFAAEELGFNLDNFAYRVIERVFKKAGVMYKYKPQRLYVDYTIAEFKAIHRENGVPKLYVFPVFDTVNRYMFFVNTHTVFEYDK